MGQKTRVSVALLGALAMFFVGGNIPLIANLLGLTRRASFLKGAASSSTSVSGASVTLSSSSNNNKQAPLSKKATAAAALKAVLTDDERPLCAERYPASVLVTTEQDEYLQSQRYFIVITLRNNEDMLHHALYELLGVVARLGPRNVFISVFENNSKDKTPQFLALFSDLLKLVGVAHNLVSTFTLDKELLEIRKAAAAEAAANASLGRRLGEEEETDTTTAAAATAAVIEAEKSIKAAEKRWYQTRVEDALYARSQGDVSGENEWWPDNEDEDSGSGTSSESSSLAFTTQLFERAHAIAAEWRATRKNYTSPPISLSSPPPFSVFGRRLGESVADQEAKQAALAIEAVTLKAVSNAEDIALLTGGKWTGNRIEFLARVRNRSIRPLFNRKEIYDRVIIMNDAFWCQEDVIRLALHKEADVACGLDFDTTPNYGVGFYDTWVTRDIKGAWKSVVLRCVCVRDGNDFTYISPPSPLNITQTTQAKLLKRIHHLPPVLKIGIVSVLVCLFMSTVVGMGSLLLMPHLSTKVSDSDEGLKVSVQPLNVNFFAKIFGEKVQVILCLIHMFASLMIYPHIKTYINPIG